MSIVQQVMAPVTPKTFTMGELLTSYEAVKYGPLGESKSSSTMKYAIPPLMAYFRAWTPDKLNKGTWKAYRTWRAQQPAQHAAALAGADRAAKDGRRVASAFVSDATACKELNILSAAIQWGRDMRWPGLQDINVYRQAQLLTARHDYLTREEVSLLLRNCVEGPKFRKAQIVRVNGKDVSLVVRPQDVPHQRLFILLAIATGARMSALLDLTWDKIRWPSGGNTPHDEKDLVAVNVVDLPEVRTIDELPLHDPQAGGYA